MRGRKLLIILTFILLMSGLPNSHFASAISWAPTYNGWPYRVPITITNSLVDTLTDFQVKVELNSTNFNWSHVKSDGGDIRFADANGNPIPYWVEKWDYTNQQATIWVKVPSIPSSGSTTIYMYYGNGTATSESNGDAVFEFFDDFDGTSLDTSKWTQVTGTWAVGSSGVTVSSSYGSYPGNFLRSSYLINSDIVVEANVTIPTLSSTASTDVSLAAMPASGWVGSEVIGPAAIGPSSTSIFWWGEAGSSGWTQATGGNTGVQMGQSYTYEMTYDTSTGTATISIVEAGTSYSHTVQSGKYLGIHIGAAIGNYFRVDWIFVRKYAAQDPTVTVGPEQTNTVSTITFSFSDSLGNTLNGVNVYANGTLLGTFNDSDSVDIDKGIYTFTFEKANYQNVTKVVNATNDVNVSIVFVPTNPVTLTLNFKDDLGNVLNNVSVFINGKSYGILDSGDSIILATPGNYTVVAQKEHYLSTQQTLDIQGDTTVTLTLDRESYLVYFYAYYNNTEVNAFDVYANSTFLGTFNSGQGALVKYGTYIFKFSKNGYRNSYITRTIDSAGEQVSFNVLPTDIYTLTFYFYNAENNSALNNVTVSINSEQSTLNSGDSKILREGNYTLTFSKDNYENKTLSLELTNDITMSVYLAPISNETKTNINQATDMKELIQNITSTVTIEPINPYAKAFLESGGSFGDTIKNAIKGDKLMKLILPQGLIFIITIIVLWQTQSPLAGLGGALIMQAMFLALLGEKPNLTNSSMTFVLVVFLVAWTLWDLFYNYSRET